METITSTVLGNIEKLCPKKGRMKTTRFVSVFDERDPVEYRIVGPFDWSCTCYIDAGTLRMVGPLRPLEKTQSDQHDDNSGSDTQGPDNPYQTRSLQEN